ncbi:acyl-CoA dehydrogenase family protein [Streptomyces sp. NBC_01429]|uniref:acyl-CoA dehydrogenase family protein n=1 Tax=Streptomyces sp. NBC_01429 TaxID=2903862 RepID=UPI002E2B8801|nr:acyl-CoA dehydrogenase [Streptomyces sp. NBC_01429]
MINSVAVSPAVPTEGAASADPATDRLTRVLFGTDFTREHGPWRAIAASGPFRHRQGGTAGERLAWAYERLRTVNDSLADPAALAADPRALAALHEWLGPIDPSFVTVAGIHYNLFLGSLIDHDSTGPGTGPDAVAAPGGGRDLSDFLAARRVGTFLCTEVAHGNDAVAVETTAAYDRDRDGFVLRTPHAGAQKFMPNTSPVGGPKSGVVAARLLVDGEDHGVFLFLTPLTDAVRPLPGVRVRRLPERFGSSVDHCLTSFDGVFVGRDALLAGAQGRLGADGVFRSENANRRRRLLLSIGRVTPGKLSMSASAVGSARFALALAVRYGGHRLISGPRGTGQVPVFAHRSHHGPLVAALATVFAMSLLHRTALDAWQSRTDANTDEAERLVAVAKGWITWRAREVIVECRERCGAQGLLENNGMAELLAGIEGVITAEGDNVAIHAKAAAELIFAPDPAPAPASAAASGAAPGAAAEVAPEERELSDPAFLDELIADVERLWLTRARHRMSHAPRGDALARWNAASGAALRAVEAHAYRRAAREYAVAVDGLVAEEADEAVLGALSAGSTASVVSAASAADLLQALRSLFALRWIDRNSGELLASGRLAARHVGELAETVEALIGRLAAHAPTLVGAFALPEEVLADRPIAGPGYAGTYDDPNGAWHGGAGDGAPGSG